MSFWTIASGDKRTALERTMGDEGIADGTQRDSKDTSFPLVKLSKFPRSPNQSNQGVRYSGTGTTSNGDEQALDYTPNDERRQFPSYLSASSPSGILARMKRQQIQRSRATRTFRPQDYSPNGHASQRGPLRPPGSGSQAHRSEAINKSETVRGPYADSEVDAKPKATPIRSKVTPADPRDKTSSVLVPNISNATRTKASKPLLNRLQPRTPQAHTPESGNRYIFPKIRGEEGNRKLSQENLIKQRLGFGVFIFCVNTACLVVALTSHRHLWVLVLILFVKSKDILSTAVAIIGLLMKPAYIQNDKRIEVTPKWIISCVTAYAETEHQIMRTITSVIRFSTKPHKMILVVILDGKPQSILPHFTSFVSSMRRPYQTWKQAHGELNIYAGFMEQIPVILLEKIRNAGKKDSLILCNDLFNVIRDNASVYSRALRNEIWKSVLPKLIPDQLPGKMDYIFCTDADSLIHEGTIFQLADALAKNPNAIGACGLVLAEMQKGNELSIWYLFQQYQYTFGQFIRRRAEGIWNRVTCMPGCVVMLVVRKEMAGAIKKYAQPITDRLVFQHQVQYLGTDRRLTYCMLSQGKKLHTLFVPHAISETVAPQGFAHYMSQRHRWGSNAYFNDLFYFVGHHQWYVTRLWAFIDIVRQTLVFYRVANTILFIYFLSRHFEFIKLVPFIVVTQTPTIWFLVLVLFREPVLRKQAHKLLLGLLINKFLSPIFSTIVFSKVMLNLGSAVWGKTGASTTPTNAFDILYTLTPKRSWTPTRIAFLVRKAIREHNRRYLEPLEPLSEDEAEDETVDVNEAFSDTAPAAVVFESEKATQKAARPEEKAHRKRKQKRVERRAKRDMSGAARAAYLALTADAGGYVDDADTGTALGELSEAGSSRAVRGTRAGAGPGPVTAMDPFVSSSYNSGLGLGLDSGSSSAYSEHSAAESSDNLQRNPDESLKGEDERELSEKGGRRSLRNEDNDY